jgi:hypothetical protein
MTNSVYWGVGLVLTILLGSTSCNREQPLVNAQLRATVTQWEHKVVYIEVQAMVEGDATDPVSWEKAGEKLSEYYSSLGADGWEYVGQFRTVYVVFKRPKK